MSVSRRTCLGLTVLAASSGMVLAAGMDALPPELAGWPQPARAQGRARFRWLGLHVYDVHLWVPQPIPFDGWADHAFALELVYARALAGRAIAERSLVEMRRQGEIDRQRAAAWLDAMVRAFPDVAAGDRLCGLHDPGAAARFFHNGRPTADVPDPMFAESFFGIWLSARTSQPELRQALLGAPR